MVSFSLEGKSALVTGASRGLGRAIALALAGEGCAIAVNYVAEGGRDNRGEALAVAGEAEALGSQSVVVAGDVTDLAAVEAMVAAASEGLGAVDILVNNAGITRDRTLRNLTKEDWDAVLSVNLTGAFHCTKAVIPGMRERGWGRVISLSSVVGLMGNIGQTNYAASKAGLIGFTRALAREVARYGITANAIAPGFIDTEMTRAVPEKTMAHILAGIPVGRLGRAEEVAAAALFLASDAAAYITGQVLSVNGGLRM